MLITDYSSSQSSARDCITLQIVTIQHLMSLVLTTKAEHKPQLWSFISTKLTSSFCELVTCQRFWKRLMGLSVGHTYCVVLLLASDLGFRDCCWSQQVRVYGLSALLFSALHRKPSSAHLCCRIAELLCQTRILLYVCIFCTTAVFGKHGMHA